MSRKVNESQKKEILDLFIKGEDIKDISKNFNFTITTITRQLKSLLKDEEFIRIKSFNFKNKSSKNKKENKTNKLVIPATKLTRERNNFGEKKLKNYGENFDSNNLNEREKFTEDSFFVELKPIDCEIDNAKQKDLSSISISEIDFPKVVYMVVDQKLN